MPVIRSVGHRRVLNSHVSFTTEFSVLLEDGSLGIGASPEGETISIYEDRRVVEPGALPASLRAAGLVGRSIVQEELDAFLSGEIAEVGRNTCYAMSLAFFNAVRSSHDLPQDDLSSAEPIAPRLCLNILNGGWHAYTNPVLSDYPEYLLVAKRNNTEEVLGQHNEIQSVVQEGLKHLPRETVSGNDVCRFPTADNRECIEFLLSAIDRLDLSGEFDLMVDASGGDLWMGEEYRLRLTDDSRYSPDEFVDYWLELCRNYPLRLLEDPLSETDVSSWTRLARAQDTCAIIGDNFYASDAARIAAGAVEGCTDGVVLKPNQAGTVTAILSAFRTAKDAGQRMIASHRSVSTESAFVATLACLLGADCIKVGPLSTDYSSVIRVNEILRLTT